MTKGLPTDAYAHYRSKFIHTTIGEMYADMFHTCPLQNIMETSAKGHQKKKKKTSLVGNIWLNDVKKWKKQNSMCNCYTRTECWNKWNTYLWCIKQVSSLLFCHTLSWCSRRGDNMHRLKSLGCKWTSNQTLADLGQVKKYTLVFESKSWSYNIKLIKNTV